MATVQSHRNEGEAEPSIDHVGTPGSGAAVTHRTFSTGDGKPARFGAASSPRATDAKGANERANERAERIESAARAFIDAASEDAAKKGLDELKSALDS